MPVKNISLSVITILVLSALVGMAWMDNDQLDDDLVFQRIDGTEQTFQQLKGRPLLVTFWSPSCTICMQEVDEFNQLYRDQAGGTEFELLALSMYYDRPDWVIETSRRAGMLYPVYFDLQKQLSKAFGNVIATPTSFLVNRDGQIVNRYTGRLDFPLLEQKLTELKG